MTERHRAVWLSAVLSAVLLPLAVAGPRAAADAPSAEPAPGEPAAPAAGEGPEEPAVGRLVRIPLPITGTVDTQVKRTVDRRLAELKPQRARPVLVLEFAGRDGRQGEGTEFERALSLARYLASDRLSRVRTVAYLPQSIRGHAVLVALACEEIVMHGEAEIGDAGIDETTVDPTVRRGYSEIADRRRTIPTAVALGMLDARLQVYQVNTASGTHYVLDEDLPRLREQTTVRSVDTLIPAGQTARFTGSQLRVKHGFVSHLAANRGELGHVLKLSSRQLEEDPSLGEAWNAIRVELRGPVTSQSVGRVIRGVRDRQNRDPINFICLWLDSPGGSPAESVRLANFLSDLDSSQVRTVAYIDSQARGDAALIALACDQLVMREQAVLGGPGAHQLQKQEVDDLTAALREIARQTSRRWSLIAALIDPELVVHRYALRGTGVSEYLCEAELAELADADAWQRAEEITQPGAALRVQGSRAVELGLARHSVASYDEFRQLYQLEDDLALVTPGWALELIDALAAPQVAGLLLFIAGFALIAELSSPGIGVAGFVSTVCFLLFFWSSFLHGTAGWLEVLLFVAGISFLVIEVLVLPGFGIFGVGGAALVITSLVLASQTFVWPRNEYQLQQLPQSLLVMGAGGAGMITALVVMRRFLARAPLLGEIVLPPPQGADLDDLQQRESVVDYRHLLGQRGVTVTQLAPAGKARVGEALVDVLSEGEVVARGTAIRVIEVRGNRVVVEPLDGAAAGPSAASG